MNEQKKSYEHYMSVSKQKQSATDLAATISHFINHNTLKPGDWILLDKLLKQINKQKSNLPRKVLRSIQIKFEAIQHKYQR